VVTIDGEQVPLLLLTGAGMATIARLRTLPALAEDFRVLAFHADRPEGDPSVARLADEAVATLDAQGVERAHVYGMSFGGMVAQELALGHPGRVRALVLAATSAGGALRVPPDAAARAFLARRDATPAEERIWSAIPYSYATETRRRHADRIGADVAARLREPTDPAAHRLQREAAMAHDTADRLGGLDVPTLVLHGAEDRLVPPENGVHLSQAIPGARHLAVPGAAHVYPTDEPDADREVVKFLLGQSTSRRPRKATRSGRAARA
jgi:3-oxoadipate enol-lactonase